MGILACRTIPVILYDWCSADEDWATSIERLRLIPEDPCILLAAKRVDENLWRRAIGLRVYDVVSRAEHVGHLVATLRFAWKWKAGRGGRAGLRVSQDTTSPLRRLYD